MRRAMPLESQTNSNLQTKESLSNEGVNLMPSLFPSQTRKESEKRKQKSQNPGSEPVSNL